MLGAKGLSSMTALESSCTCQYPTSKWQSIRSSTVGTSASVEIVVKKSALVVVVARMEGESARLYIKIKRMLGAQSITGKGTKIEFCEINAGCDLLAPCSKRMTVECRITEMKGLIALVGVEMQLYLRAFEGQRQRQSSEIYVSDGSGPIFRFEDMLES